MRTIAVEIQRTYITANVLISDRRAWESRGFESVEAHDESIINLLGGMTEGTLLVVLGNLFSKRTTRATGDLLLKKLTEKHIKLMCVEGNQDHRYLWQLKRDRKIELLGDMALLESSTVRAVVSAYPMAEWPQKRQGCPNFFGFEPNKTTPQFVGSNGGYNCSMNTLMLKFRKSAVSLQLLFDQIKKNKNPEALPH